jgi:pimeloyl-ACP methyl ester carboxylesterase
VSGPLVFVHGSGGSHHTWFHQTANFKGSVAVDLPGHPIGPPLHSAQEYARWVRDQLVAGKLADVVIVGHSFGGGVALSLALDYPELLSGLVLIGTGATFPEAEPLLSYPGDHTSMIDWFMDRAFARETNPVLAAQSKKQLHRVNPETMRSDFEASRIFDVRGRLSEIDLPTLVIYGVEDQLCPPQHSHNLHEHIRGSRLEIIPQAGHLVMLEKPLELNDVLARFLVELREASAVK